MNYVTLAQYADALRADRDAEQAARLLAEQAAIDEAGGVKALGANEDERRRALGLALLRDANYQVALRRLRATEARHAEAEAALKDQEAEAQRRRWEIRAALVAALRGGDANDSADPFDAAGDAAVLRQTMQRVRNAPVAIDDIPF